MSFTNISASDTHTAALSASVPPRDSSLNHAWLPKVANDAVTTARLTPGQGAIRVISRGRVSVVEQLAAASPLRLLTPRNHGHAAWIFTSSFGGGFVDGDCQAIDIEVAPGAAAYLSTQASTKVYRSVRGASANLRARVAEHGLLVVAPDPVVCFADSRFTQRQQFDVALSGALIVVDWMTSGRRESGERWSFAHYTNRLIGRLDRTLVVHEAMSLRREDGDLDVRLGRFNVLAVVLVMGVPLRTYAASLVGQLEKEPVRRTPSQLAVATPLAHQGLGTVGCVVRIAGQSVEAVGGAIRSTLSFVPALLGDDPWARKW
jgi:urease accessory protein